MKERKMHEQEPEREIVNYAQREREVLREKTALAELQRRHWKRQLQGHLTGDGIFYTGPDRT